jgi:thiazole synthase ThiGH ThiG subunit
VSRSMSGDDDLELVDESESSGASILTVFVRRANNMRARSNALRALLRSDEFRLVLLNGDASL